ncbi:MAG: methyltetrahydrofolate cobalamin methyltransferase [Christensenellales bacterium]|jgi:5-methyltetrahydrofolate corrinoid/iron sulfur protein methyltransferase
MLIVGELINTSRKKINMAVENRDAEYIKDIAKEQVAAGANYIDVNCGTQVENEVETMEWLVNCIQEVVQVPLCFDSPNPQVIEAGLVIAKYGQPMINSITAERERYNQILPLVLKYNTKIVALCMDDNGMPETAIERIVIVGKLYKLMKEAGVQEDDMYFDPLVKPISVNSDSGKEVMDTVRLISQEYPNVHKICGLSNVSYGLPNRPFLNRIFMNQTMAMGMDAYILNPLDQVMMASLYGAMALTGKDSFCMGYLNAHRQGLYENIK